MYRMMMKSKIHSAIVTEANLNYVGSITIDEVLMEAANIYPHEQVHVVNKTNGARFETYAIPGPRHSGTICLNGAAARLVQPQDVVIIITYGMMQESEACAYAPTVVFMDEKNRMTHKTKGEKAGQTAPLAAGEGI